MNSFISTIFINTNSYSSEKIAVALLIATEEKIWYKYATHKVDIAEKLMHAELKKHLQLSLKLIENKVDETNYSLTNNHKNLIKFETVFSDTYFSYLNKYSSGLLHFENPKPIAKEISEQTFLSLYALYVGDNDAHKKTVKHFNFHQAINEKLKNPLLIEKADIDFKIQPSKLDGIYSPVLIKLATKNGVIQAYQDIDFTTSVDTIAKHLYEWEVLTNALNKFSENNNLGLGTYKVIFNKPEAKSEQEGILNKVNKSEKFGLVQIDEVDNLINDILNTEHVKLSALLL
jgi:hypothetical protein